MTTSDSGDHSRPSPRDLGDKSRPVPGGSIPRSRRSEPLPGWQRIGVELPERLFEEIKLHANADRVSVARWIASAAFEASRGYRDGFRFEHHGVTSEG